MFVRLVENTVRGVVAALSMLVIVIGAAQVVWRYALSAALPWSEELLRYSFVWITFLGAAIAARQGSMASFGFLDRVMEGKARHDPMWSHVRTAYRLFGKAMAILASGLLLWYGIQLVLAQARTGQLTPAMGWPIYVVALAIPVGAALMVLCYVSEVVLLIARKEG